MCIDTTERQEGHAFVTKDPITKIVPYLWLNLERGETSMMNYVTDVTEKIGFFPKIWISDADTAIHNAICKRSIHYRPQIKGVRTIWLGRIPKDGKRTQNDERSTYTIELHGTDHLRVWKGTVSPSLCETIKRDRHHLTGIQKALQIFQERKPSIVCLRPAELFIHSLPFLKRLHQETEGDGYVYHIVGTGTWGNNWAERTCRMVMRRADWCNGPDRVSENQQATVYLQGLFYNLLTPQNQLGNLSPFRFAGAEYTEEVIWDNLLHCLQ